MAIERKNSFHLLLSDDELKLLQLLAEREGLNASDYLRSLLRQLAVTPPQLRFGPGIGSRADMANIFQLYADAFNRAKVSGAETKKKKKAP